MPNVLLTTGCNLRCEYCFAQEKMRGKSKHMSMQDVRKVIAFLKQSDYPIFRAMGGEPTLHPRFQDIIRLALQEGMRVDLLSNATWHAGCNDLFARILPNRLLFLLNIDHPDIYHSRLWTRIERNLAALAGRKGVTFSFNIFEKQPRYKYVLDLAARYGIRMVRLSFSLPVLGVQNTYLEIEEYRDLAPFIMEFIRQAEAKDVGVRLDNAVPLCIFTYEQAGELLLKGVLDLKRNARCEPIVDIGPDLTVWCCFCLSKLSNRHLGEFQTLQAAQDYYQRVLNQYQGQIYPMDECCECQYQELWACQGGCITYSIMRHGERQPDRWLTGEIGDFYQDRMRLGFSEQVVIGRYEIPEESFVLSHLGSGIDIEVDASLKPLWNLLDGQHTVEEVVDRIMGNGKGQGQSATDDFVRRVREESLHDLLLGLVRQGFLIQQ